MLDRFKLKNTLDFMQGFIRGVRVAYADEVEITFIDLRSGVEKTGIDTVWVVADSTHPPMLSIEVWRAGARDDNLTAQARDLSFELL